MKNILFLAIFTLIISAACSSSPDVMDTAIDKHKELDAAYEIANDAKAKEDRLDQEEEEKKANEANTPKTLEPGISTGDPRKDEIDMFKRIVSENTGPACNIYGIAPCPEWPNFIKTKPDKGNLPVYKETICEGKFNTTEYLLKTLKDDYVTCLINASKSDEKPYMVAGSQLDPGVLKDVLEAEEYGADYLAIGGLCLMYL